MTNLSFSSHVPVPPGSVKWCLFDANWHKQTHYWNPIMKLFHPVVLAATLLASFPALAVSEADYFGSAVPGTGAGRTIAIDGTTRYINVTRGDTVTFVVDGNKVSWNFDGIAPGFPLSKILKLDAPRSDIKVYVAAASDM